MERTPEQAAWYAEAARLHEESRVPLTLEEKVAIADHLYDLRVIEKLDTHWEWTSPTVDCTGPELNGILDILSESQSGDPF